MTQPLVGARITRASEQGYGTSEMKPTSCCKMSGNAEYCSWISTLDTVNTNGPASSTQSHQEALDILYRYWTLHCTTLHPRHTVQYSTVHYIPSTQAALATSHHTNGCSAVDRLESSEALQYSTVQCWCVVDSAGRRRDRGNPYRTHCTALHCVEVK
jgi:hypothetical protein